MRQKPNIIITGTPGVGKTSHCELLAQRTDLRHLSINQVVKERGCHEGWDKQLKSWIVDEDQVRHTMFQSETARRLIKVPIDSFLIRSKAKQSREASSSTGMHVICSQRAG